MIFRTENTNCVFGHDYAQDLVTAHASLLSYVDLRGRLQQLMDMEREGEEVKGGREREADLYPEKEMKSRRMCR